MANREVQQSRTPNGAPLSGKLALDPTKRKPLAVGDVVNGKYLIEAFIGEGGVGIVAAAQNLELDERVALKFLKPEMLAQTEIVARFLREAKAASSIKSEYVATVYDVGTMPDGSPFLVMEHLEGKDLGAVTNERGRLGHREATEYIMQACEALAVAHAKGVVHRDIKPENLFLTSRAGMSVIKLLDFGISKAVLTGSIFGSALPLVKTMNLMGTPLYMSPEQVRSADGGDARSDIWALGMVLFEILTGTLPFSAPTITELCAAILEAPMVSITTYRDDLPPGYVETLERCIARDPNKRFQNVAEMAIAFMPFAPKRARICAERAAQALRAAGLVDESSVRFASTVPPPSSSTNLLHTSPSLTFPRGGASSGAHPLYASASGGMGLEEVSAGSISIPRAPAMPSASLAASPASASSSAPHPSVIAPAARQSRVTLALAFVGVAAIGAAVAAFGVTRMNDSSKASQRAMTDPSAGALVASAQPPATVEAAPRASAPGSGALASTPVAPSAKKAGPAFAWPVKGGTPPPTTKPAAGGAPGGQAGPAKKSTEEPDLGY